MGDLLVRDVNDWVIRCLKDRARANGTSLQHEASKALASGAAPTAAERQAAFDELDRLWGDRPPLTVSGAELVREVRDEAEGWS